MTESGNAYARTTSVHTYSRSPGDELHVSKEQPRKYACTVERGIMLETVSLEFQVGIIGGFSVPKAGRKGALIRCHGSKVQRIDCNPSGAVVCFRNPLFEDTPDVTTVFSAKKCA